MPNGTTLMNLDDFKIYHSNPTKLIKSALNIANQLFCHPSCHQECHLPYSTTPPRTLKNDYTIINHTIIPQHPTPLYTPESPYPPPTNNMFNNPRQFPIHTILDHKQRQLIDSNGIKRNDTSYLCQWITLNNTIYNKWRTQRELFPYCDAYTSCHNTELLTQYYTKRQHKHFTNIVNAYFSTEQLRDTRYVILATIIPLAHISINECNPESDIETNTTLSKHNSTSLTYMKTTDDTSLPSQKLD